LSQPLIANIHGLKEVKEGGEVDMEEKNQQDRLLGVNPEGPLPRSEALEILVSPPFEDYAQGWSQI
jgi:hypothetical protein